MVVSTVVADLGGVKNSFKETMMLLDLRLAFVLAAVVISACGGGTSPSASGGAEPDAAAAADAVTPPPTLVQVHDIVPSTSRVVFYHHDDGTYAGQVALDEEGRATIDDMPANGIVTVAFERETWTQLASLVAISPGDLVAFGKAPEDRLPVEVVAELPADNPPQTDRRVVQFGCGGVGGGATSTSTAFTTYRDCFDSVSAAAMLVAYDAKGRPTGYALLSAEISDNVSLDFSGAAWTTQFGQLPIVLSNAPFSENAYVSANGLNKGRRMARDYIERSMVAGEGWSPDLRLPVTGLDGYRLDVEMEHPWGWVETIGPEQPAPTLAPSPVTALSLDTHLMNRIESVGVTLSPTTLVTDLTEVPRCESAGVADDSWWNVVATTGDGRRFDWSIRDRGERLSMTFPGLGPDGASWWPEGDFEVVDSRVEYVARSASSFEDGRLRGERFGLSTRPRAADESTCATAFESEVLN